MNKNLETNSQIASSNFRESLKENINELNLQELKFRMDLAIDNLARNERKNRCTYTYNVAGEEYSIWEIMIHHKIWAPQKVRRFLVDTFPNEFKVGVIGKGSKYGNTCNRGILPYFPLDQAVFKKGSRHR
jgi:hypothetical protein